MLDAPGRTRPADSAAIAFRIRIEMGLGGDHDMLADLLGRLEQSAEANVFAALNHLLFVAPKWHGSIVQMWEVANAYAGSPRNAAWIAIAARAHIEEWLFSVGFNDDEALRDNYLLKLQDPGFRKFIGQMDETFWRTNQASPATGAEGAFAHNTMACLLMRFDLTSRMRAHLEKMGPYITGGFPWSFFSNGEPMEILAEVRRRAGLPLLKA